VKSKKIHGIDEVLDKKAARKEMFADLFGKWTEAESLSFEERIKDMERIEADNDRLSEKI
jgi:hypothetical protein